MYIDENAINFETSVQSYIIYVQNCCAYIHTTMLMYEEDFPDYFLQRMVKKLISKTFFSVMNSWFDHVNNSIYVFAYRKKNTRIKSKYNNICYC